MTTLNFVAEAAPTAVQFNGFWVVASFMAFFAANIVVVIAFFRKSQTRITPQPLEIRHEQGAATERDCLSRFESNERQIAELKKGHKDAEVAQSIHRKTIYKQIEAAGTVLSGKVDAMEKKAEAGREKLKDEINDVGLKVAGLDTATKSQNEWLARIDEKLDSLREGH